MSTPDEHNPRTPVGELRIPSQRLKCSRCGEARGPYDGLWCPDCTKALNIAAASLVRSFGGRR